MIISKGKNILNEWINCFQSEFDNEVRERLRKHTLKKFGKMPLFIFNGGWTFAELVKRQRFQDSIYISVSVSILRDAELKTKVENGFTYRMTGNGVEIEILKQ